METSLQTLRIPHLGKRVPADEPTGAIAPGGREGAPPEPGANSKVYSSEALFGRSRDLTIMHRGERYSLRITSLGRLILTK